MESLVYVVPIAGVLALVFAYAKTVWINKQDPGDATMVDIAAQIREGAMAFSFSGDARPNSEQALGTPSGIFVSFRRDDAVQAGWLDATGKPKGDLANVVGSGGKVGKPRGSWNGKEGAITFADLTDANPSLDPIALADVPGLNPAVAQMIR